MKGITYMLKTEDKPVVYFDSYPEFWMWNEENEVASLHLVYNHPHLGYTYNVRTSTVLKKFEDGSFETRNTMYKPVTEGIKNAAIHEYLCKNQREKL